MKINKLKVFFISCFIVLLVSLSAKNTPNINASAISPPQEVFSPKNAPDEYLLEKYNHCGSLENDLFICSFYNKYTNIVYSNTKGTFVAFFDKNMYKVKESKIVDNICIGGKIKNEKLYLIDNNNLIIINYQFKIEKYLPFDNITDIQIISNEIYLFCKGNLNKYNFEYGYVVSAYHNFINAYNKYFVFKNNNEILITDFDKKLVFEIDNFLAAKEKDNTFIFASIKDSNTIITSINNFTITYTTLISQKAFFIDFEFKDNNTAIFLTNDKTYLYTLCNHGDVISCTVFSDKKYIDVFDNIYEEDNYVFININNKTVMINYTIYHKKHALFEDLIIFDCIDGLETFGANDIYIAQLKK